MLFTPIRLPNSHVKALLGASGRLKLNSRILNSSFSTFRKVNNTQVGNHSVFKPRILENLNKGKLTSCLKVFSFTRSISDEKSMASGLKKVEIYNAPLSKIVKIIKYTSVLSISGIVLLSPWFFILESSLPLVARISLLAGASVFIGGSVALVNWAFNPYITKIELLDNNSKKNTISRDALLLVNKIDAFAREKKTIVRVNTLSRLENVPMRTWTAISDTTLSDFELEKLQNLLYSKIPSRNILLGKNDDKYFAHTDLESSQEMVDLIKSI
ncbi:hypothetical protein BB560_004798 [Smittium megazygosporum]|uniref:Uncharacterized protein n=1 Tax=Smittium megazygosporum TaxID=133381 RepID=A0A2T9Z8F0_9FUNG|nr:hypothetical protein BB560_004798 [Smittium megazygosporum]